MSIAVTERIFIGRQSRFPVRVLWLKGLYQSVERPRPVSTRRPKIFASYAG
jgi:hypothetical protein